MAELETNLWAGQAKTKQIFWGEIEEKIHNFVKNICYKLLTKNLGKKEDYLGRGIGEWKGIYSVTMLAPAARTPAGRVTVPAVSSNRLADPRPPSPGFLRLHGAAVPPLLHRFPLIPPVFIQISEPSKAPPWPWLVESLERKKND